MAALVVLFDLQDEAAKEAYEKWAQTTDVPTVKGLASIDDFKVFRLNSVMGSKEPSPYQYCEIILINDMEKLGAELETATMKRVASEFQQFALNPTFIVSEQIA